MRWLLLLSHDTHAKVSAVLHDAGETLLPTKDPGEPPDAVVLDHGAQKRHFLAAGFWRGYGLPVVFIGKGHDRRNLARVMGFYTLTTPEEFGPWLRRGPAYLQLRPGRTRNDLAEGSIAALREIDTEADK